MANSIRFTRKGKYRFIPQTLKELLHRLSQRQRQRHKFIGETRKRKRAARSARSLEQSRVSII